MSALSASTVETPVGSFSVIANSDGMVLAAGWTREVDQLISLIHPSLRGRWAGRPDFEPAISAVRAYFDGDCSAPSTVPVGQRTDGGFVTDVWAALRRVEPGAPVSYRELASRSGRPDAIRAAATACARNAAALFVPCHRVVRTDGRLGGFRWGLDAKRWLLAHEAAQTRG